MFGNDIQNLLDIQPTSYISWSALHKI